MKPLSPTGTAGGGQGSHDRSFVPGVGFHLVEGKLRRGLTGVRGLVAVVVHPRCRRRCVALYGAGAGVSVAQRFTARVARVVLRP